MEEKKSRSSFSGSFGFVMAAAGSAVGLGNIWRFPYLAAKDGGGIFLLCYIVIALTFGFTLLITEISIGRKTKQGPLTAYSKLSKKGGWIGGIASLVPFMIMPYYCVIGGWVLKYFCAFISGSAGRTAEQEYFGSFISSFPEPIIFNVIFLLATVVVIYIGVEKGIEKFSKILMPILILLVLGISVFSLFLTYTDASGHVRTGLQGFKIYVVPDFSNMTLDDLFGVITDAMGQLFYSISVAMGIMIAYGSYVRDEDNIPRAVNHIEFFDTMVAFLAGVMIIPAVYVFMGREGMENSGPGLMFQAMPKIFDSMGVVGIVIGIVFFLMVLFAALTSSISIMEAIVSGLMDKFGWSRRKATVIEGVAALLLGIIICLGYNVFYFELKMPNGKTGQLLDIFDFISNNMLMPVVAIATCILIGWILKPDTIVAEATKNGEKLNRAGLYKVMIKFIAPVLLLVLFLVALGIL